MGTFRAENFGVEVLDVMSETSESNQNRSVSKRQAFCRFMQGKKTELVRVHRLSYRGERLKAREDLTRECKNTWKSLMKSILEFCPFL